MQRRISKYFFFPDDTAGAPFGVPAPQNSAGISSSTDIKDHTGSAGAINRADSTHPHSAETAPTAATSKIDVAKIPTPVGPDSITGIKERLRGSFRASRKRFRNSSSYTDACAAINANILELASNWQVIAAFAPVGDEPDIMPALEVLYKQGKTLLLPKLGQALSRRWAIYKGIDDLIEQAPKRPLAPSTPALDSEILQDVDGVLLPALAVDSHGTRLGQGGGWYDRVLTYCRPDTSICAITFADEFVSTKLPKEPHDIAVKTVITPAGIYPIRNH